jgi:hypothetical protein
MDSQEQSDVLVVCITCRSDEITALLYRPERSLSFDAEVQKVCETPEFFLTAGASSTDLT